MDEEEASRPLLIPKKTLDDTMEQCIGEGGIRQTLQALVVSLAWFFDAQQTFISVFADAPNSFHCTDPSASCADRCTLPNDAAWAWDRPARTSVFSDWGLDCGPSALAGLPASAFFSGCVLGNFLLSTLADSCLGRRRMLFLTCSAMCAAAAATALAPNVWVYAALRFLAGFWRATLGTSSLVLATEIVARRQRARVAVEGLVLFTLGFLSLPGIAYLCRDLSWRHLYAATAVPGLLYSLVAYSLVPESPRWLAVRGRRDEAIATLKTMAASNGRADAVLLSSFSGVPFYVVESEDGGGPFSALRTLAARRWSLRRLALVMTVGFGTGLLYYGMPLAVGDLGGSLYLNVAVNALSELPSSAVTALLSRWMGRRPTVLGFAWASCALCLVCMAVTLGRMAAEVVAFFCACTLFDLMLIYGLELFPTCVRNSALSMLRQAVVLGGAVAPVLVAAGREGHGRLTFGVFAAVVGVCGSFVIFLPETRGEEMCDTMEEEECREELRRTRSNRFAYLC